MTLPRKVAHRKEYIAWKAMHERCSPNYHNSQVYKDYVSRGITVCERWSGPRGWEHFYTDMGNAPSPAHSLDRIDNDKGYFPDNCRWATRHQQNANRRTSKTYGAKHSLYLGVSQATNQWNTYWVATLTVNKQVHRVYTKTEMGAIIARQFLERFYIDKK